MFLEGFGSASIVNGVFRVQTLFHNAKGETVQGDDLLVPATRLVPLSEELQSLIAKIRDQEVAAQSAAATEAEAEVEDGEKGKKDK